MGKVSTSINDTLAEFMRVQTMFFVASAPLDAHGHVNLSPKGLDTFRILGPTTVAYLDLTGSGVETIAHLRENGRIVIMFCAFQGPPNIVRLHGRGHVVEPSDGEFASLQAHFPVFESTRSIIVVEVSSVSESCGYGVPLMQHEGVRPQLRAWAQSKGPEGLQAYRQEKNRVSIDGLPGVGEGPKPE
jgi:hypothetical protein